MSKILEQIHLWLEQVIITLGYTGIMVVMFLESLFPPIPSELLMPFAGFLASQGHFSFSGILLAGTAGSLLGALTLYYLGQYVGEPLIRTFIRRYGHYLLMAERDLNRVDYRGLTRGGRESYDQAKGFIEEAKKALKERNFVYAQTTADKAGKLATELVGR